MKPLILSIFLSLAVMAVFGQDTTRALSAEQLASLQKKRAKFKKKATPDPQTIINGQVLRTTVLENGDTIPVTTLADAEISAQRVFKSAAEERRYRSLEKKVRKVYPYAKLAGEKLRGYEGELAAIDSERKKKKFYKKVEKELKAEFGDELTKLTVSQGRILIKLIDRETGDTSYELVSELRGNFSAFFWQGLARIFGHNLKSNYDPEGEDRMIEEIVQRIESEG
ncbi:MAG: DUF4294 domain-containing protein [Salibacteraceae bacterium]